MHRLPLLYSSFFTFCLSTEKMGVAWWNLQSQLLVAIQKDDVMRAKELLADGVDCDARFLFGSHRRPALCLCVERDSLDLGMYILIHPIIISDEPVAARKITDVS